MKKRFRMGRSLLAGAIAVAGGGGILALGTAPAGASSVEVTAAGSFTTYQLMHNIFGTALNDLTPGFKTSHQVITATATGCATPPVYSATGAPNGSTAGKHALFLEQKATAPTKACIDFGRSSSPPTPTTLTKTTTGWHHFDYYAYALDGVTVMTGSHAGGSRATPVELSLTQIKDIYLCKPGYRTWHTVTGGTGPIIRFWPQTGSGTRSVYTGIMGFTPDKTTYHTAAHTSTCGYTTTSTAGGPLLHNTKDRPITTFTHITYTTTVHSTHITKATTVNEENSEQGILYYSHLTGGAGTATWDSHHYGVPYATAKKDGIYIYSAGKFEQQWDNTATFNKTTRNSINNYPIGNFTATTLLLAEVQSRTATVATTPFVDYGQQTGTFTATHNRGTYAINTSVVKEQNEWYSHIPTSSGKATTGMAPIPGVRYVWNVADTALPTYSEAKALVGFNNLASGVALGAHNVPESAAGSSALCHGDDAAAITASGFVPLNSGSSRPENNGGGYGTGERGKPSVHTTSTTHTTQPATSDNAGAYCREFIGGSYPDWGTVDHWTPGLGYVQAT